MVIKVNGKTATWLHTYMSCKRIFLNAQSIIDYYGHGN
jgi:hypothetical protein